MAFGLLFGLGLVFVGCASFMEYGKLEQSARQNYQSGNYDLAVSRCADSLKANPEYDKAQALIQDAFKAAVNAHESKIKELKPSSTKFKWDEIVSEYNALIKANEIIRNLPTLTDKKTKEVIKFKLTDYTPDLTEAKKNAAEDHYQEGLRLSKKEGIDFQKQAAKEFKASENFSPGYKAAASLYEKCRQAGIKRIAIIPFEDNSGKRGKYGAISETIVDGIVSEVMNDPSAIEFLEIISRGHLNQVMQEQRLGLTGIIDEGTAVQLGKVLGVHEILTGKVTQIIYTPERTIDKTIREEGRAVVGTEKYIDEKGKIREKDIWGDVYASVTIYTRTTNASIAGSYNIIDVKTAKLKKSESFVGKADFESGWATFSGDERALSYESKRLCKRSEELAPVEEEMAGRATRNLIASLTKTLKQYAR